MAVETYEVVCRYNTKADAEEAIRVLARNGWVYKQKWQEGDYWYVRYDVPRIDSSVNPGTPGPGAGNDGPGL
ncbi:MAG: hypothetical protein KBT03_09885 [Bacteroidales bacterium]|nr:hypothetical protein [Candidatus Scybalousia scybalohippi]